MSGWHTRVDRASLERLRRLPDNQLSPALLFFKWQPYDEGTTFKSKQARSPFLEEVARRSNAIANGHDYRNWHAGQYLNALEGLAGQLTVTAATTVWRLVVGLGSNPAFEAGLQIHALYGFPYIPGSSVRGLVRHVAESELMEKPEEHGWLKRLPTSDEQGEVSAFLDKAERLREVFGSLSVKPLIIQSDAGKEILGWTPPRSLLETWKSRPEEGGLPAAWDDLRPSIRRLLGEHTGGVVSFYDAVPAPGQEGLLQTDIVNPHYPDYYRSGGSHPPSDDQDPVPVTFLAVRPGAAFDFPFRVTPRTETLRKRLPAEIIKSVSGWLKQGLELWGAGGKTAAGYGYLTVSTIPGKPMQETATAASSAGLPPRHTSDWRTTELPQIQHQTAADRVPRLLAELSGPERREAARLIVEQLNRRWLRKRADLPWVQELFAAETDPAED